MIPTSSTLLYNSSNEIWSGSMHLVVIEGEKKKKEEEEVVVVEEAQYCL
ncbi:hypothetical protein EGR_09678 [Echinococcus granulosus]|uniref:Uncharacterized protein n=1 Tax=Echinococcus granulosus TaxID=6210 RepID=W6U2Y2_ECHGR|nr:hypothetical protein EGR_09678 [Echinococcus granulosus]EUB55470.1 hypothetical protein EGR_09678 [Echinococcus granulosus]